MINLTELVKEYKLTKNKTILNSIYLELKSTIVQKAKFIYYRKWYPLNLYHFCKYCKHCTKLNNIPKKEHNLICKECEKCKCIKGFFNLKKDNLCEYSDVENDIWLEVLRVIENFDITKNFNTYLFSCLWEFVPSFITKDFIKSLSNQSLTQEDSQNNEPQIDIIDENQKSEIYQDEILKICKTKREREVINLFFENKTMTQEKAGKILNITHQAISLILHKLQNRLRKYLQK